jgi:RHS repeat-associated protein
MGTIFSYDLKNGLYYFNHRWYDPSSMRFLSKDPAPIDVNDPRTINRYTFVYNNPLRYVDPDGRLGLPNFASMFKWTFFLDTGKTVEEGIEMPINDLLDSAADLVPDVKVVAGIGPKAGFKLGPIKAEIGAVVEGSSNLDLVGKAYARATVKNIGPQASLSINSSDLKSGSFNIHKNVGLTSDVSKLTLELEKVFLGVSIPAGNLGHVGLEFYYK